jgi:two-component SAPR family response regulator
MNQRRTIGGSPASRRRVLIVARDAALADRLLAWLAEAGHEATLVTTFSSARFHLEARPDLLISEIRLGEYNGLHLALRAHGLAVPSIVIGPHDPVLEKDAEALHTVYLQTPIASGAFAAALARLLPPVDPAGFRRSIGHMTVTTVAAEAEVLWRAFSDSSASESGAFERNMLPN